MFFFCFKISKYQNHVQGSITETNFIQAFIINEAMVDSLIKKWWQTFSVHLNSLWNTSSILYITAVTSVNNIYYFDILIWK